MIRIYDGNLKGDCPSEAVEQINSAGWLELHHPGDWALAFHVPNEIKASPQYMAKRRKMGVKSGPSDWIIARSPVGAFEMKRQVKSKSKVSPEQIAFLKAVDASGGFAAICYGFEQFKLAYSDYRVYCASIAATKAVN